MVDAYKEFFSKYTDFKGRTSKNTYWYTVAVNLIISLVLGLLATLFSKVAFLGNLFNIVLIVFNIAILIPSIAMQIRRFHDINKSGWFTLLGLIPIAGPIILIVFSCMNEVNDNNKYAQ